MKETLENFLERYNCRTVVPGHFIILMKNFVLKIIRELQDIMTDF
jgi:hypothetical protein